MLKRHAISVRHAFSGLVYAVSTQPNFIVHLSLSVIAILLGFIYHINLPEWVFIVFTIALGLVIELVNTSIEAVVDLVTQEHRLHAKIAKDTAAAAMLVYSVGAATVAALIFLPKTFSL